MPDGWVVWTYEAAGRLVGSYFEDYAQASGYVRRLDLDRPEWWRIERWEGGQLRVVVM